VNSQPRLIELPALAFVAAAWLLAARSIHALPAQIPTHFAANGAVNAMGPAYTLWFLPIVITAMYVFLSALQFIPVQFMNVPVAITDRNRARVYALVRTMLPLLKAGTLLILLSVEWAVVDAATRGSLGPLFFWAVWAPMVLLLGILVYFVLKMRAV
jgi:hypothetical protein